MEEWLKNNIVGIIGIIISGIIAYHLYYLSKKITFKDKLLHKEKVGEKVGRVLEKIKKGMRRKVELINVKRYSKDYPHKNDLNRKGYVYMGAELKGLCFDGVEFFCAISEAYKNKDKKFSFNENDSGNKRVNLYEVGVVPCEWIEYIDLRGDEFSWRPQFFVQFKGENKSPYKYLRYYEKSDSYHKGEDPIDMQWRLVELEDKNIQKL